MKIMTRRPGSQTGVILLVLCLVMCLMFSNKAYAHARMIRSVPAKDSVVQKSPEQLEFWFNELLENGFNTIEVFKAGELNAAKHTNLAKAKPVVDPKDPTHMTVKLDPLPPGEYVAEWRVLSRDGHSAPGRIIFKVGAAK